MIAEFEQPPINEVVLGVQFPPLEKLKAETIGLFWSRIRNDFPTVTQNPIYSLKAPPPPQPGELFPLPRFWFLGADNSRLIQLQNGAFFFNWRRQIGEYPRFARIFPDFLQYFDIFQTFLKEDIKVDDVPLIACELAYTNLFGTTESLTNPSEYKRVVTSFTPPILSESAHTFENFNHIDVFRLSDGNELILTQKSGRRAPDDLPVFILELKISGRLTTPLQEWFTNAHNRIIEDFVKLTNPKIQADIWKRK